VIKTLREEKERNSSERVMSECSTREVTVLSNMGFVTVSSGTVLGGLLYVLQNRRSAMVELVGSSCGRLRVFLQLSESNWSTRS